MCFVVAGLLGSVVALSAALVRLDRRLAAAEEEIRKLWLMHTPTDPKE